MMPQQQKEAAPIRDLPANTAGRDFFLGDLHGETGKLAAALESVGFDPGRDRVIAVGDLIDRGPDSLQALALAEEPWFFTVRGNHEQMMADALAAGADSPAFAHWMINGGAWIKRVDPAVWPDLRARVLAMPIAITLRRSRGAPIGVVHAEYPLPRWDLLDTALADPPLRERLLWGRRILRAGAPHITEDVAATVHGHTPIPRPAVLGNAVFIDTGAVYGGPLTLMPLDTLLDLVADARSATGGLRA
ncbi:MAG: serine/threonine protein phosphatase [Alphaproteobacteria bacterium]|nr:MAG: serine/threonine protein phosphatase [Alphaproteobacteria bacterium]